MTTEAIIVAKEADLRPVNKKPINFFSKGV